MRESRLLLSALLLLVGGTLGAQTRTLNVGGGATINYEVTGRGPTVVFIHGWSHNMSVWDDQIPAFKTLDRKSTRLNSSHLGTSYAGFCFKKKNADPPAE